MSHPYLHAHELRPTVHLACSWQFGAAGVSPVYRVRSHHLIMVESGWIEARVHGNTVLGRPGDLICFGAAEANQYSYARDTLTLEAQLEFAPPPRQRLSPWFDNLGPLPAKVALGDLRDEMRAVFETICMTLPQPGVGPQFRLRAAVFELLALLAAVVSPQPHALRRLDPWQRVVLQLDTDLSRPISLRELAAQVGLSVDGFIRQFKHRFGMTPKAYHLHARLREGARLIHVSDRSIKEIAYALGFSDPKYFARQFRKHQSAKPSDMRRAVPSAAMVPGKVTRPYPINELIFPPTRGRQIQKWLAIRTTRAP